jgi:salicylate synthase
MSITASTATSAVPLSGDLLESAAMLAYRGPFDHYLVYERPGSRFDYAAGAIAELTVFPGRVEVIRGGQRTSAEWQGDPLPLVSRMLAELPVRDHGFYGWAAFELGYALAGQQPEVLGYPAQPLLRLVVPQAWVRLGPDHAEVSGEYPAHVDQIRNILVGAEAVPDPSTRVTVDIDEGGQVYQQAVASAIADIYAGRLRKVVLSRTVEVSESIDLAATYVAARRANGPARSFLLRLGDLEAAGVSPETVVVVDPDRRVSTQPLAGTRARTGQQRADRILREELLNDPKEIYEHAISMQIAWQEMSGICEPDTVRVEQFMTVAERGCVQHLASRLSGRLAETDAGPWAALATLFPGVTASGVPKPAAYELIREHESSPRGLYGGAVIISDGMGDLDAALALRTVFRSGGRTWLRAGAGIVRDSDPHREFEETCHKLRSISRHLVPQVLPTAELAGAKA